MRLAVRAAIAAAVLSAATACPMRQAVLAPDEAAARNSSEWTILAEPAVDAGLPPTQADAGEAQR